MGPEEFERYVMRHLTRIDTRLDHIERDVNHIKRRVQNLERWRFQMKHVLVTIVLIVLALKGYDITQFLAVFFGG